MSTQSLERSVYKDNRLISLGLVLEHYVLRIALNIIGTDRSVASFSSFFAEHFPLYFPFARLHANRVSELRSATEIRGNKRSVACLFLIVVRVKFAKAALQET